MASKKKIEVGGDFVGRDRNMSASDQGVVIGGNVTGSTIITGNNNVIGDVSNIFQPIYRAVDESPLAPQVKEDVKAEIAEVETEVKKGDGADEGFLRRRLASIKNMAPDIFEVMVASLGGPMAAVSAVVKKVAEKMRAEAKARAG